MNRTRWLLVAIALLLLGTVGGVPRAVYADSIGGTPVYFAETGHSLGYNFRLFYEQQGGKAVFGYPISEVFLENGVPIQYFENARLEWHANLGRVEAGLLGTWAARDKREQPPFQRLPAAPADGAFFEATGHSLSGAFYDFWLQNGATNTFGLPISEPHSATNPPDGQPYTVQYFERARFELRTAPDGQPRVSLTPLGASYLAANPAPAWATQPVASADAAWQAVRPTRIQVPRIGVDTGISMSGFSYGVWEVPRWTAAHYWPVAGMPGTNSNIVLAGHVGYPDIIFSYLPQVQTGDDILLTVNGGERPYVVTEILMLLPEDTWVMAPTDYEVLTLITCYPVGIYTHRMIVRALPADAVTEANE